MRIVIACDQKWRDLPSLVVIKHHLHELGHRVFIHSTKIFESLLPIIQPDCVVLNNFWDIRYQKLAEKLRERGIAVVVLPTEGATSTHLWGPLVFGEFSNYSLIDYQMCWNAPTANGIAEFGSMPPEKLDVIGCPRFDFSVAPMKESCMTREQLCELLELDPSRPIVTWASRFALAKMSYASSEARKAFDRQLGRIGIAQCLNRRGYAVQDHIDNHIGSLEKFLDAFGLVAEARPDVQFLFKPHPNDDVNYIEKRLPSRPNVRLAVGVYIGDVLRGSDVLVNADCSTSIEAWVHGIPVIDAQLRTDHIAGRPDISAGNWVATEADEVLALVDRGLTDPAVSPDLISARDQFIKIWYGNIDGRRCEAAARSLHGFLANFGNQRKLYPVAYGGGVKHVVKNGVGWILDVPGGTSLRDLRKSRLHIRSVRGVYDKVISRRDVRKIEKQLSPLIASGPQ